MTLACPLKPGAASEPPEGDQITLVRAGRVHRAEPLFGEDLKEFLLEHADHRTEPGPTARQLPTRSGSRARGRHTPEGTPGPAS